jgi:hypothetical protein
MPAPGGLRLAYTITCPGASLLDNSIIAFFTADAHRFQTTREKYLGHLLSVLLIIAYYKTSLAAAHGTTSYQWVNDNTGAIAWVNANKCSSLASSFACMAVSQLNMLSDFWAADAIHILWAK